MVIEAYNNSFILKAAEKIQTGNPQPMINQTKNNEVKDSFEKNTNNNNSIKKNLITTIVSGITFAAIWLLPDLLMRRSNCITPNLLKKLAKYKPLIGNELTSHTQAILKNGNIKISLEKDKGRFKCCETVIMNGAKIKQRIISLKEKLSNGKYILRELKSYKGDNLVDNDELIKNESKYLIKHFKRTPLGNKEHKVEVKKQQQTKISREIRTSDGQPIFKIFENDNFKENTVFLYSGEQCVGIDKQIVPKAKNKAQYNILTLPNKGIFNHQYNFETDGHQYDESLKQKLLENF